MKGFMVLFVLTSSWRASLSIKLPDYIKPCRRYDPNVNACALKSAKEAVPHVINGDPTYNAPKLDPMAVEEFVVKKGSSSIGLTMAAHDVQMYGIKDVDVRDIKIDFDEKSLSMELYFPELLIKCIYNVTGRVLILPIEGYGNGTILLGKVMASYKMTYDLRNKTDDDQLYVFPLKSQLHFDPKSFRIKLENLFNGNKLLGDNMNYFMNENWKEILKEVGPALADTMAQYMQSIFFNIFQLVPLENVFIYD